MGTNNGTGKANTLDLMADYATDPQLEQDGVWCDEFRSGLEFKVRSSQSKEVKAAFERQNKRCEKFWKTKQPVPESLTAKNNADIASAAVADWRQRIVVTPETDTEAEQTTVTATINFGGEALECTDDNKKRLFSDARLWSLRLEVMTAMNTIDNFKRQEVIADLGNSPAPSAPASSSAVSATE